MTLSKFEGIDPYVANRVRAILEVADRYGGQYTVTSGVRSSEKQWELWRARRGLGVALPGCSTHQWGWGMDVHWPEPAWAEWYRASARSIGLHTVSDSPTHVQAVSWQEWRRISLKTDWCPAPGYLNQAINYPVPWTTEQLWWWQRPELAPINLLA